MKSNAGDDCDANIRVSPQCAMQIPKLRPVALAAEDCVSDRATTHPGR